MWLSIVRVRFKAGIRGARGDTREQRAESLVGLWRGEGLMRKRSQHQRNGCVGEEGYSGVLCLSGEGEGMYVPIRRAESF